MERGPFWRIDTTPEEVIVALDGTGASDQDVLFAAKTEFAGPFKQQKRWGSSLVVAGVLLLLTVVGAPVGVLVACAGIWARRKGERNLAIVDGAFAQYQAPRRRSFDSHKMTTTAS